MPYIVVNRDGPAGHSGPEAPRSVLSRVSPNALLSWIDLGVSRATDYRYAVLFETYSGARKCAGMQGGSPCWVADVDRGDGAGGGVVPSGDDRGLVEVE